MEEDLDALSDEYLLERHSYGATAGPFARQAIEVELKRRGVAVPTEASDVPQLAKYELPATRLRSVLRTAGLLLGALISSAIAQQLARTTLGLVITGALLAYAAYDWIKSAPTEAEAFERRVRRAGLTPLMLASAEGNARLTSQLLSEGADPNETTADGTTALMYAARNDRADIIVVLRQAGADVSARSRAGSTAAMIARRFDHKAAEQALTRSSTA